MTKMPHSISTTNACKLCKPLGASLAFRGIAGCVPFLHGSQGCATYMRRYIISHFNEPIDIASSSLGEKHAVYGGAANLKLGLRNVIKKYRPQVIGVATTCLTETIGDDVARIIQEYLAEFGVEPDHPRIVSVSTPSYSGTHMEGFHAAVRAVVEQMSARCGSHPAVNLLPGFVSAADLRYLKDLFADLCCPLILLPDYSETLDGPAMSDYPLVPEGGTPLEAIETMGGARATLELGRTLAESSAGTVLQERHNVPLYRCGLPIGIRETDRFLAAIHEITGTATPERQIKARGRLIDALVDSHKYIFGKRAVVYGEEDLVVGLTSFLAEIGIQPVLCASGGKSGRFAAAVAAVLEGTPCEMPEVYENADFFDIEKRAGTLDVDLLIGHSKGYALARRKLVPLVRVGFPIHDRMGGQRILHLGYHGAQLLFDIITNTLIAKKQDDSDVGYSYM